MRAIKSRDTNPEMVVRRLAYSLGYRFRLHSKSLPGKPDLVFPGRRKIIFVNGCFWHGHDCRRGFRAPKDNAGYWATKIIANRDRDIRTEAALRTAGWSVMTLWECETRRAGRAPLAEKIAAFLGPIGGRVCASEITVA
ncbi:DNA mismatch endonuclease Vsr [Mesorhizobium sp. M8A.F.Ca.ET.161.01.1.1]|nr:DNA mismatch endonuclease Vsr [Mesorhizobium sp. M8A.F.Ca.ET.161.01.1.1]TGV44938.1 DNA mismatch endonuclease Vsr [Mesorhizobium sp. M8A.F.Ca.ET.142.01.1.1]